MLMLGDAVDVKLYHLAMVVFIPVSWYTKLDTS